MAAGGWRLTAGTTSVDVFLVKRELASLLLSHRRRHFSFRPSQPFKPTVAWFQEADFAQKVPWNALFVAIEANTTTASTCLRPISATN